MSHVKSILRAAALLVVLAGTPAIVHGQAIGSSPTSTWKVGDAVQVLWAGAWYPARILQAKGGTYLISYDGYNSNWDEWVAPARVRAREQPRPQGAPAATGASAAKPGGAIAGSAATSAAKPGGAIAGSAAAAAAPSGGSKSPVGRYVCQTFVSGQLNNVGEFVLAANGSYQDRWNKGSGRYTFDSKSGRIRFTSGPQKNDRAVVKFLPNAGRGKRGTVQFTYPGGARLDCYR